MRRRDLGLPGWGWEDVLPYFKRGERHFLGESALHGGAGELSVTPLPEPHPASGRSDRCRPWASQCALRSADPGDPPKMVANFLSDEGDVAPLVEGVRLIRRIFATAPFREHATGEALPGDDRGEGRGHDRRGRAGAGLTQTSGLPWAVPSRMCRWVRADARR